MAAELGDLGLRNVIIDVQWTEAVGSHGQLIPELPWLGTQAHMSEPQIHQAVTQTKLHIEVQMWTV